MKLKLDNSKRSTFVKCPYRYNLAYVKGIVPSTGSTSLRYGSCFHSAMEGLYSHIAENGWTKDGGALSRAAEMARAKWDELTNSQRYYNDYRDINTLLKALVLYYNHFYADEGMIEVLATEMAFKVNLPDDVLFTGRLDMEMKLSGQQWVNEFKTTGRAISYIAQQQNRDPQFIGYAYALRKIYGEDIEGFLITYHHLSAYKSKKTGDYGEPKIEFDRIPQFFTDNDLTEWLESFLYTAYQIRTCIANDAWPKQFDSCYVYGACPYLFLCEQRVRAGSEHLADKYTITQNIWDVLNTVPANKVVEA